MVGSKVNKLYMKLPPFPSPPFPSLSVVSIWQSGTKRRNKHSVISSGSRAEMWGDLVTVRGLEQKRFPSRINSSPFCREKWRKTTIASLCPWWKLLVLWKQQPSSLHSASCIASEGLKHLAKPFIFWGGLRTEGDRPRRGPEIEAVGQVLFWFEINNNKRR